jgi:hypothetical protein
VTERGSTDLEIPHGWYLKMDQNQLDAFLEKYNLRLGYLYKFTHYEKKDKYTTANQVSDFHLVGVNNIIL